MRPAASPGEINVAAETAIIDGHISGLQVLRLLDGQSHFAEGAGFQSRVVADSIEQIVHDRQASLGIACAGGPLLIGGFFPAKGLAQFLAVRQAHQRTVNAKEPVFTPPLDGALRTIDGGQHAIAIQFDEGGVLEFGASMGHRSAGLRFKDLALGQLIEKFVQMALDGFDGFLEDEKHQHRESQLAVAREVFRVHPMTSQEWIAQLGVECLT